MKVKLLKNAERDQRIFILANGPSLAQEDLTKLRNEIVIGMNASSLLEQKFGFVSKYYTVTDQRFLTHPEKGVLAKKNLHDDTIRIFRSELQVYDDANFLSRTCYVRTIGKNGFSTNLSAGFYFGCTTTMLAIQLAYYLGGKDVYLLGCDCRYSGENPRFYKETSPQLEDSFTSTQIFNIANAAPYFEKRGGNLFNCSKSSYLRAYLKNADFCDL
ncbi:6-hydroxymethylpterin diphosphokinase MptE-like protein [Gallibacterium sp. AGMB14963]|uniref:6-hydroxymethylpterin diphosphokinase MptE-like protein n=1 Tax=Gallibacterium faecale TaxID=3019086 RepID=UPI0022F194AC|nr:6-hydroxymethylpterin diphosphokinase MptE-like protein [Gallibacterium sp. AGMB14963]MDA3978217.1 DUF115 domain-containing protein [Gallibacterium sp. AGMB14963]